MKQNKDGKWFVNFRPIDEMDRDELKKELIEAFYANVNKKVMDGWVLNNDYVVNTIRKREERRGRLKRIICLFKGHRWRSWFGNEYTCERCKKIGIRVHG